MMHNAGYSFQICVIRYKSGFSVSRIFSNYSAYFHISIDKYVHMYVVYVYMQFTCVNTVSLISDY